MAEESVLCCLETSIIKVSDDDSLMGEVLEILTTKFGVLLNTSTEITLIILSTMSAKQLLACREVCKLWCTVANKLLKKRCLPHYLTYHLPFNTYSTAGELPGTDMIQCPRQITKRMLTQHCSSIPQLCFLFAVNIYSSRIARKKLYKEFTEYLNGLLPKKCLFFSVLSAGMIGSVEYDFQGPHLPQPTDCFTEPPCPTCINYPCSEPYADVKFMKTAHYKSPVINAEHILRDKFTSVTEWRPRELFNTLYSKKIPLGDPNSLTHLNFKYIVSTFRNLRTIIVIFNPNPLLVEDLPIDIDELWFHQILDDRYIGQTEYRTKCKLLEDHFDSEQNKAKETCHHRVKSKKCCKVANKKSAICVGPTHTGGNKRVYDTASNINSEHLPKNKKFHGEDVHMLPVPDKCVPNCELLTNCCYPFTRPAHGVGYSTATVNDMLKKHRCRELQFCMLTLPDNIPGVTFVPFKWYCCERDIEHKLERCEMACMQHLADRQDLKAMVMFEHSDYKQSLRMMSCITNVVIKRHGEVALCGSLAKDCDSQLSSNSADTKNSKEFGVAVCGDGVTAASIILGSAISTVDQAIDEMSKFQSIYDPTHRSLAFMTTCCGRGNSQYKMPGEHDNIEVNLFKTLYPNTPLVGTVGYGEIGHEYVPQKDGTLSEYDRMKMNTSLRDLRYLDQVSFNYSYATTIVFLQFNTS